jgi:hypothetical protein
MSTLDDFYICIPRRDAKPAGERVSLRRPQDIYHRPDGSLLERYLKEREVDPDAFLAGKALQKSPDAPVVLQLTDVEYEEHDDPKFDPRRNWLVGITGGTVLREVPLDEVAAV